MKKFSLLLAVLLVLTLVFGVSCDGSTSEPPADSGSEFDIDPSLYATYRGSALGRSVTVELSKSGISVTDGNGNDLMAYLLGAPVSELTITNQETRENYYHVEFSVYEYTTTLSASLAGNILTVNVNAEYEGAQDGTYTFTKLS